jgi:hypothetical protein
MISQKRVRSIQKWVRKYPFSIKMVIGPLAFDRT